MALKSLRVTKKEIQNYYSPKVSDYEMMTNSISSPMGYGQIIQAYNGTEITNTYFHVYDYTISEIIVMDKTSGTKSSVVSAGPTFWGVTPEIGVEFLNGYTDISGFRKLKYCNGCSDGNGLSEPVINNFSKRFKQLSELVSGYNLLEGFLFYDLSLPKYSNVFPSVKVDDGVNVNYKFKNVNTGADLTPNDVSVITGEPVSTIETSVDTAPVVKPQEGANTVITSCCDESISYVISGQYTIGNILYTDSLSESYCWFVESLTKDLPSIPSSFTFTSGGRSCQACVKLNPCPAVCETVSLAYSMDPLNVCTATYDYFNVDWNTSEIFYEGSCGENFARSGYYYDGKMIYYFDGNTFSEYGECTNTSSAVNPCCDGDKGIIEGVYPIGTILYTKGIDPATCFIVVSNGTDEPTLPYKFNVYEGRDCKACSSIYPGGCK